MMTTLSKMFSKASRPESTEEGKPNILAAQSQPERYEKQEKSEKHEKQEKQAPEKYEKREKRGAGNAGAIIAGLVLIIVGAVIFVAIWYNISIPWWPIFLILAGIAIIVYGVMATAARHRSPPPPP